MCWYLNNSPSLLNESTESKQYSARFYYDWSDGNLKQIIPIFVPISNTKEIATSFGVELEFTTANLDVSAFFT